MKIEELKIETESEGELVGLKANISLNNISFLFKMLAERYSDKYASIVREYTCNALDSHTEAGVTDKNVIVSLVWEDDDYKLKFQDFGVGLSPDRIKNVFVNYLESTKRETDDLIGGFGKFKILKNCRFLYCIISFYFVNLYKINKIYKYYAI